ncbi:MAG TPA: PilN domain-containing protein [Candidatus Baltobacteraceae bacterium]
MIRFNFLRTSQHSFLDRARDLEVTTRTRQALVALTIVCAIIIFGDAIEQARLVQARGAASAISDRLDTDQQAMAGLRTSEETVHRLAALSQSVTAVQDSGTLRAAEFAEIGDRLPAHLWLTSIHQDHDGLIIDGGAQNYSVVGEAIGRLEHARTVGDPVLVSSGALDPAHPGLIDYEVRLQEREQ